MIQEERFFIITNNDVSTLRPVYPNFKKDVAIEIEEVNNQRFYRSKMSGKLSFLGEDFDFIMSKILDTKFTIVLEQVVGDVWLEQCRGSFFRTDADINEFDKIMSVQLNEEDIYSSVVDGLDKEFDLITLKPVIESLSYHKRPLIQVYIPGESIVSCFISGTTWEQDVTEQETNYQTLIEKYHFSHSNVLAELNVTGSSTPNVNGLYYGRMQITERWPNSMVKTFTGNLVNPNGLYRVTIHCSLPGSGGGAMSPITVYIFRISDGAGLFQYTGTFGRVMSFNMSPYPGSSGNPKVDARFIDIFSRYVLDVTTIQGINTYVIPDDDIVAYNRNYTRVIGYQFDVAYISMNTTVAPGEYGRRQDGLYYAPPYTLSNDKFYPIARTKWGLASVWFLFSVFDPQIESQGRKLVTLRDAYPVSSVINVLLKQLNSNLTHEATPEYSKFLYNDINPVSFQSFRLYVTPKSNVLNGEYQQPAQKAITTLGAFLKMLRDCFRCFWYIEDNKLKIEHVSWFMNGGGYLENPIVGLDLTTLINIRNNKPWSFGQNDYNFDKMNMPERYQFKWMDDVTQPFAGYPMQIISNYVQKGKIEEISLSQFTSDIDMMLLNSTEMNKDGFALLAPRVGVNVLTNPGTHAFSSNYVFTFDRDISQDTNIRAYINNNTGAGFSFYVRFLRNGALVYQSPISYFTEAPYIDFDEDYFIPYGDGANTMQFVLDTGSAGNIFYTLISVNQRLIELPFITQNVGNIQYVVQNGVLSFINLLPNYYMNDLPARNVIVNNEPTTTLSTEKNKKQEVSFPVPLGYGMNMFRLIKTNIGNGKIEKMSINLLSRSSKTTLKHDTE